VLWGRARLAQVTLTEGHVAEAHRILVETIDNFYADGNRNGLVFALDRMAGLCVVTNKHQAAARLIGWSDATRKEIGDPRPRIEQADLDREAASIKAMIGGADYEAAYGTGQGMTLDEVVALALDNKKQA
jgi:hypothetical protein